jgi:hypothetical protein
MSTPELKLGDSIKSLAACDRLPKGVIVGFAHPRYTSAHSAVRREAADGSLQWEMTGHDGLLKTRTIKQMFGWAPFVVLALPGEPVLNDEVRIGYRTYGKATAAHPEVPLTD